VPNLLAGDIIPGATFQDVFDEDELKLILDSLKFDMGCTHNIKDAVKRCVEMIQSDTLGKLKDEVQSCRKNSRRDQPGLVMSPRHPLQNTPVQNTPVIQ
jgi:hypothetical protein